MALENTNFGFLPSVMDGTEWVFGAPSDGLTLPKKYSYRKYLPDVLDVGSLSICVPCSCSAYLNWMVNLKDGSHNDNKIALMDIYAVKTTEGDGMTFKEAFHFLRHGSVKSAAGNLHINSYGKVMSMYALKYAIVMNGPCFGALPVYSDDCDFWNKKPGYSLLGYHAISIVGYDENGFIIRNSWGKSFCDNGYTVLPYEEFNKLMEAWTIMS